MNKTAVTVLQELMVKLHDVPNYECVSQSGPQHQAVFEYRCSARGVTARGVARSKKEAKQEAARRTLAALAARGTPVPPPYHTAPAAEPAPCDHPAPSDALPLPSSGEGGGEPAGEGAARDGRSYVALLKELCEEYMLGALEFELVSDTGPSHERHFTQRARVGRHERVATATTKKAARQLAAECLYTYLRDHLATSTKDFVEKCEPDLQPAPERAGAQEAAPDSPRKRKAKTEDCDQTQPSKRPCEAGPALEPEPGVTEAALSRALDKAMARYVDTRQEQPWRPNLGQCVADYHLGLCAHLSEEMRAAAEREVARGDGEKQLSATAAALGLRVEWGALAGDGGPLHLVSLAPTAPELTFVGGDRDAARAAALRYVRRALAFRPDAPIDKCMSLLSA